MSSREISDIEGYVEEMIDLNEKAEESQDPFARTEYNRKVKKLERWEADFPKIDELLNFLGDNQPEEAYDLLQEYN